MIQNSFIFLEKVKKGIENKLWRQGINSWDAFLSADKIDGLSLKRKKYYDRKIIEARKALYNFDSLYFKKHCRSQNISDYTIFLKMNAFFSILKLPDWTLGTMI